MTTGVHDQSKSFLVSTGEDRAASDSHQLAPADTLDQRDANTQPPLPAERRLRTLIFEAGHEDYVTVRRLLAVTGPERSGWRLSVASELYASLLVVEGVARGAE